MGGGAPGAAAAPAAEDPLAGSPARTILASAHAYLRFAARHPATYQAMFARDTALWFASEDTPEPLRAAFAALRDTLVDAGAPAEPETGAELFWAALHGLATLTSACRLRPDQAEARVTLLVAQTLGGDRPAPPQ